MKFRRDKIHSYINAIALETLEHIKEREPDFDGRWVPSVDIKDELDLEFLSVPIDNKQYGKRGWLHAIISRLLEDEGLLEYKKVDSRAYYRSKIK